MPCRETSARGEERRLKKCDISEVVINVAVCARLLECPFDRAILGQLQAKIDPIEIVFCRKRFQLEFDPFFKERSESCAFRGSSIVVVCPFGDLAVDCLHDACSVQQDGKYRPMPMQRPMRMRTTGYWEELLRFRCLSRVGHFAANLLRRRSVVPFCGPGRGYSDAERFTEPAGNPILCSSARKRGSDRMGSNKESD